MDIRNKHWQIGHISSALFQYFRRSPEVLDDPVIFEWFVERVIEGVLSPDHASAAYGDVDAPGHTLSHLALFPSDRPLISAVRDPLASLMSGMSDKNRNTLMEDWGVEFQVE